MMESAKATYLGKDVSLKYPTVDDLARRIFQLQKADPTKPILMWKEDLDRAFRQLFADIKSVPLLGYRWRDLYYFDLVMVMASRIAPYICQRTTNMLAYVHRSMSYFVLNYVDDFIGAEFADRAAESHNAFKRLLRDVGVERSAKKSVEPTEEIEFVGNLVNTRNMTIGVTGKKTGFG